MAFVRCTVLDALRPSSFTPRLDGTFRNLRPNSLMWDSSAAKTIAMKEPSRNYKGDGFDNNPTVLVFAMRRREIVRTSTKKRGQRRLLWNVSGLPNGSTRLDCAFEATLNARVILASPMCDRPSEARGLIGNRTESLLKTRDSVGQRFPAMTSPPESDANRQSKQRPNDQAGRFGNRGDRKPYFGNEVLSV